MHLPIRLGAFPVAMVTGGLCGGMVLDSLRSWRLSRAPAGPTSRDLSRVFGAQLRSFQISSAPAKYLLLQRPGATAARRRANRRARDQLTLHLGAEDPVPLALVCRLSSNPFALTAHHVVLAYALQSRRGNSATFAVYDPNHPGDDRVRLRIGDDGVQHSHRRTVHAAFVLHAR